VVVRLDHDLDFVRHQLWQLGAALASKPLFYYGERSRVDVVLPPRIAFGSFSDVMPQSGQGKLTELFPS
jgi:hypothetical protein